MWWRFLWFIILATFALELSAVPSMQIGYDAEVRAIFAEVLVHGGSGELQSESAAFVVADAEERPRCIGWPESSARRRQTFSGVPPVALLAIVHTHPRSIPRPSVADVETARAAGVPVFVVTPLNIWVATPDGEMVPLVTQRFWAPARRQKCEPLERWRVTADLRDATPAPS